MSKYLQVIVPIIFFLSCAGVWSQDSGALPSAGFKLAGTAGQLESPDLFETSGLAASRREPDLLWALNDGGNRPAVYALNSQGKAMGCFLIQEAENHDWEDLASFSLGGIAYLMIADTGDNVGRRKTVQIYIVKEPKLSLSTPAYTPIPLERKIRFQYPDGPADCEAVSVDPVAGTILLISKRTVPPVIYSLPLNPKGTEVIIASRIGTVPRIPRPTAMDLVEDPRFGVYRSQPTSLDITSDGTAAVVLTYKNAYVFQREAGESWAVAMGKTPRQIKMPKLDQSEAVCFSPDGRRIHVTSEGKHAPLVNFDREADSVGKNIEPVEN